MVYSQRSLASVPLPEATKSERDGDQQNSAARQTMKVIYLPFASGDRTQVRVLFQSDWPPSTRLLWK